MRHRRLRIEHPFVDIDVDDICSIRDLLARNCDRALEIAGQNQFGKLRRTGDIRSLADDSESKVARDVEWLEAGKLEGRASTGLILAGFYETFRGILRSRGSRDCSLGSARVSRTGRGVSPRRTFYLVFLRPNPRIVLILVGNVRIPWISENILKFLLQITIQPNVTVERFLFAN